MLILRNGDLRKGEHLVLACSPGDRDHMTRLYLVKRDAPPSR
jgi:hypothetical protein